MEQTAVIKIRVELKETATETFEMLIGVWGEGCLNVMNVSKEGVSYYKPMDGKAVFDLPEH
jgi:hypothetical protein